MNFRPHPATQSPLAAVADGNISKKDGGVDLGTWEDNTSICTTKPKEELSVLFLLYKNFKGETKDEGVRLSYHYESEYVGPLRSKKPSQVLKLDKLERDPGGACTSQVWKFTVALGTQTRDGFIFKNKNLDTETGFPLNQIHSHQRIHGSQS